MQTGIPCKTRPLAGCVARSPEACSSLVQAGYADELDAAVVATIAADAPALYRAAQLMVKLKEPVGADRDLRQCGTRR